MEMLEEGQGCSMRPTSVAILPSAGIGHLNPLLEFARRLVSVHGVRATLFVITTQASPRQRDLLADPTLPAGLRFVYLTPVDVSGGIPPDARAVTRISTIVRASLPSLREALTSEGAAGSSALVVDLFSTDAFDVADELGLSKYLYFTTSAWLLTQMMHLPALDRLVPGSYADFGEELPVPGCRPVPTGDLVNPLQHRENEEYAWFLYHASRYPMARGILVNTWEGLEPASLRALREEPDLVRVPTPPVFLVGPLTKPVASGRDRHQCLAWLDHQPAGTVLFVSFGSRGTLSTEQTTELALGLEQSGQRFLWVARRPTGRAGESLGAFLPSIAEDDSMGEHLPDGFLERTRERGLVVPSWAPQVAVLSHPAVGGFLTHVGWNSAMESIVHGLPMIAWPLYAEQKMNATMLSEDLKVAVRVRPHPPTVVQDDGSVPAAAGVVGREEVEKAVRLVMEGDEGKAMRERVRELRRGALRTLEEGGSSHTAMAEVVNQWKVTAREDRPLLTA